MTTRANHTHNTSTQSQGDWGHISVLREEVVRALTRPEARLIDGTLGQGGHAAALLEACGPTAQLLGIDLDADRLATAQQRLREWGSQVSFVHSSFAHIATIVQENRFPAPTGILFDLGMASPHLAAERGFSFQNSGSLDMRYDHTGRVALPEPDMPALRSLAHRVPSYTAFDVLCALSARALAEVLETYGDERYAKRIADVLTHVRPTPQTAQELADLVVRAMPSSAKRGRIHAATRTFQALRIAVNREMETVRQGVQGAISILAPGGVLAVISFHSGEDRIVKRLFREARHAGLGIRQQTRVIRPSRQEFIENPRSRSAKLRLLITPTSSSLQHSSSHDS